MADFYTYLSGTNGNNGKSAYELWKERQRTGNMNDPKNPDKNGLLTKFQNMIFFNYLAGKDGINGSNGLSAHELWKMILASFCTTSALIDHKMVEYGTKKYVKDFYDYLHGKDGKDGEDGKDGKPGERKTGNRSYHH